MAYRACVAPLPVAAPALARLRAALAALAALATALPFCANILNKQPDMSGAARGELPHLHAGHASRTHFMVI